LLLAVAFGAAAGGDALETRISLVSAAGGFDAFADSAGTPAAPTSLALQTRPAAARGAGLTPRARRAIITP
jgi:hypothetical protein